LLEKVSFMKNIIAQRR